MKAHTIGISQRSQQISEPCTLEYRDVMKTGINSHVRICQSHNSKCASGTLHSHHSKHLENAIACTIFYHNANMEFKEKAEL